MIRLTSVIAAFLLSTVLASSAQEFVWAPLGHDRHSARRLGNLREPDAADYIGKPIHDDKSALQPHRQNPVSMDGPMSQSQVTGNAPTGSTRGKYIFGVATYQIGQFPRSMTIGDFNGDGIPDVATANIQDNTLSVLLGNPDGTFTQTIVIPLTVGVPGIAAGDLNGDGKDDLIIAEGFNGDVVSVLLSNGDGTFQSPVPYAAGTSPFAITVRDVNGDGKLDLIVANDCTPFISVFLGNGDGTLKPHVDYDADFGGGCGSSLSSVAVADLNGDGKVDLAFAVSSSVSVLLGNGDGTFQGFVLYGSGAPPTGVAIGDFNGDKIFDLAVTRANNTVSILLGVGDGTFPNMASYPTGAWPATPVVADFNGDGKLDLVTANGSQGSSPLPFGSFSVLLGNGDGTFQTNVDHGTGVFPLLAAADFNGDGIPDLAVTSQNCVQFAPCGVGQLAIVLGNGDGTFFQSPTMVVNKLSNGIDAPDLNGDGKPDLVVGNWNGASVFLGSGNGSFQPEVDYAGTYGTIAVVSGDFNGDNHGDIALLNSGISMLLGNGDGTLQGHVDFATAPSQTSMIAGDFNNDKKLDLVTVGGMGSTISILLGNGDGTFKNHVEYAAGSNTMRVAAGDFNRDGKLDLVVTNFNSGPTVALLLGNGDGTFQPPQFLNAGPWAEGIVVGDFNGDGKLDIAVQNYYNSFGLTNATVLLGNGDGTFQAPVSYQTNDIPISIAVADVDGDGKLDLVMPTSSYVAVLYGNGDGTFQSPVDYLRSQAYGTVLAADLIGNGATDLAIVGTNSGTTVSLQLNSPQIALYPSRFTFYRQAIGYTSLPKTFLLSNPSVAPLKLSSIAAVGDFNQTNTCGSILNRGTNCTLTAKFQPILAGVRPGGVLIQDHTPSGLNGLFFSGLGYAVTMTPNGTNFGIVTLGKTGTKQVIIANRGGGAISINSITILGPDRADFSQTNTCGTSIAAHGSCTMTISFKPSKVGTKFAAISITDSDAWSPRSLSLRGIARVR